MRRRGGSQGRDGQERPAHADVTPRAINRAVLAETLQRPFTILPLAVSVASLCFAAVVDPATAILASVLSGLVGTGVWVFNYFIRGERFASEYVKRLRAEREMSRHIAVSSIETDCRAIGFEEGAEAASSLLNAYRSVHESLSADEDDSAASFSLLFLAEDTYEEGVGILRAALEIYRALEAIDEDELKRDVRGWKERLIEIKTSSGPGQEADASRRLRRRIESNERSLEMYRERSGQLRELLVQCEELKGALERTHLHVSGVGTTDVSFFTGSTVSELERAVAAARRVEERLRSWTSEEDQMYLEAGRESKDSPT